MAIDAPVVAAPLQEDGQVPQILVGGGNVLRCLLRRFLGDSHSICLVFLLPLVAVDGF